MVSGLWDAFTLVLGNWQMISLGLVILLFFYRNFHRKIYEEMWGWFQWKARYVIPAVGVILAFQIREILCYDLNWIHIAFPEYSLAELIFFYAGNIHIRSILFYAIMIFYLWRKFGSLLPAVLTGWFWIGLIELTFIPQHLIWLDGLFLGVNHYLPFVCIMAPWIFERKRFQIPRRAWIWFSGGIFLQYFGLLFGNWAVVHLTMAGFLPNPMAQPHPHLFTYCFEICQHLMKTLFTVAAAHTVLEKSYRGKFHRAFKPRRTTMKALNQECDE